MRKASGSALGREGEEAALQHLAGLGYRILRRNVRFRRMGEIDAVAEEGGCLVFVEVKTRTGDGFGTAAEAITRRKQQQLVRLAQVFLAGLGGDRPCRFDVVAVERASDGGWVCSVIRDAFAAS